jgi:hypothetical protein
LVAEKVSRLVQLLAVPCPSRRRDDLVIARAFRGRDSRRPSRRVGISIEASSTSFCRQACSPPALTEALRGIDSCNRSSVVLTKSHSTKHHRGNHNRTIALRRPSIPAPRERKTAVRRGTTDACRSPFPTRSFGSCERCSNNVRCWTASVASTNALRSSSGSRTRARSALSQISDCSDPSSAFRLARRPFRAPAECVTQCVPSAETAVLVEFTQANGKDHRRSHLAWYHNPRLQQGSEWIGPATRFIPGESAFLARLSLLQRSIDPWYRHDTG